MADLALVDPLGRTIVLHDHTWFRHIIRGHPDVAPFRNLVASAVQAPLEIRFSRADADCRLYFGMGPRPGRQMLVVGDIKRGLIKTSHVVQKSTGGDIEWARFKLKP